MSCKYVNIHKMFPLGEHAFVNTYMDSVKQVNRASFKYFATQFLKNLSSFELNRGKKNKHVPGSST